MIIQLLLIVAVLVVAVAFLRNRNTMRFQAGKKLLFFLFVFVFIASVVNPDLLTRLGNLIGVGRGADLLLYMLVVAFLFASMNTYLKFKDLEVRLTRTARRLAVSEALRRDYAVEGSAVEGGAVEGGAVERGGGAPVSGPDDPRLPPPGR